MIIVMAARPWPAKPRVCPTLVTSEGVTWGVCANPETTQTTTPEADAPITYSVQVEPTLVTNEIPITAGGVHDRPQKQQVPKER